MMRIGKEPKKTVAKGEINGRNIKDILGVRVTGASEETVLIRILAECNKSVFDKPFFVVTANPEIIMAAEDDESYKRILNSADLVLADGAGLKLAGIKEVVPGRKLVRRLLGEKLKVFYLGGRNGVAQEMARRFGGESDEGCQHIENQMTDQIQNSRIINKINRYRPDLLLVAYGAPWQERWIGANLDQLKAKVVMGVGGTFDYLTGRAAEPLEWVSRAGWEWLWRLVREPWRWRRQLALVRFTWKVLLD